ncbi:nitroreductase [Polaromonas sp. C04]|uniref:nitroreductase n=1 Tax=Polaromonas sp. C04 TaxID=1945857 RepID=UPI000986E75D|nr:nitroreductase [Polaromonas sp. C04]OOG51201.1 nitrobenzoate reductase [Polaromonas sp. C04]
MSALRSQAIVRDSASVDSAMESRFSCRAFLRDTPVPRRLIDEILHVARYAPSGTNTQPWKVYVLQGSHLASLTGEVCEAFDSVRFNQAVPSGSHEEHDYYPRTWQSPYLERRRENGWGLYGVLGITKGDKEAMHLQHRRNYQFFDAPVGLIFTMDRNLRRGSLIDYGMFMQNIMLAARARGLNTCPQAAWTEFSGIVLRHLGATPAETLVCGMALGFADEAARVNTFQARREDPPSFTCWLGEAE